MPVSRTKRASKFEAPPEVLKEVEEQIDDYIRSWRGGLVDSVGLHDWQRAVYRLHEQAFLFKWKEHVDQLNSEISHSGGALLRLQRDDLPPAWFDGNVEKLEKGQWILFVSLNPQIPGSEVKAVEPTPESWWKFWLNHDQEHWGPFFRRPVVVASNALGQEVSLENRPEFAANRMVFVEVCPYASAAFDLDSQAIRSLSRSDIGFIIERQFFELLLEGEPAAVLVNGHPAIDHLDNIYRGCIQWTTSSYPARGDVSRTLWHLSGRIDFREKRIPLFGFPFLGKPRTHNSYADVKDLGNRIRIAIGN